MKLSALMFVMVIFAASGSEARVFNFKDEGIATYFRGTAGLSNLQKSAFANSGGTGLTFSDQTNYNYSGEFGVLFNMSRAVLRLGLELYRPNAATGVEAKNSSSTVLYTVTSTVISYGGVMNLEFNLSEGDHSRLFFSAGGGYFNTTLENDYKFTSAGTTAYGVADYVEQGSAPSYMGQASFGYEFLLSSSVTAVFDSGYRSMLVNNLKHTRDANALFNNTATPIKSGDTMKNNDGTDRSLDLSGIWVGLGLRFYINL